MTQFWIRFAEMVTLAVIALSMTACATSGVAEAPERAPIVVSTGGGLSVVTVQEPWVLQLLCQGASSTPAGSQILACVVPRDDMVGVTVHFRRPPDEWGLSEEQVKLIARVFGHETCHEIHQVIVRTYRGLEKFLPADRPAELAALVEKYKRDPCHDEDGGRLHR